MSLDWAPGLLVALGLVLFIVPGILLIVRYALLDPAVVLEGAGATKARSRSTELTIGVRWQIFWAGLLFFVAFLLFSFLIYLPVGLLPQVDTMATWVILDCLLDVAFAMIQIVMFLYYWEATTKERLLTPPSTFPGTLRGEVPALP